MKSDDELVAETVEELKAPDIRALVLKAMEYLPKEHHRTREIERIIFLLSMREGLQPNSLVITPKGGELVVSFTCSAKAPLDYLPFSFKGVAKDTYWVDKSRKEEG